jgi:hypothetical protein
LFKLDEAVDHQIYSSSGTSEEDEGDNEDERDDDDEERSNDRQAETIIITHSTDPNSIFNNRKPLDWNFTDDKRYHYSNPSYGYTHPHRRRKRDLIKTLLYLSLLKTFSIHRRVKEVIASSWEVFSIFIEISLGRNGGMRNESMRKVFIMLGMLIFLRRVRGGEGRWRGLRSFMGVGMEV